MFTNEPAGKGNPVRAGLCRSVQGSTSFEPYDSLEKALDDATAKLDAFSWRNQGEILWLGGLTALTSFSSFIASRLALIINAMPVSHRTMVISTVLRSTLA
jgi:hypothetical protein